MCLGLTDRRSLPKRLALLAGCVLFLATARAADWQLVRGCRLDLSDIFATQLGTTLVDDNGYEGFRTATAKYVALELPEPVSTNRVSSTEPLSVSAFRPERLVVDARTSRVVGVFARSPVFPSAEKAEAVFNQHLRPIIARHCQGCAMTRLVNGFAVRFPCSFGDCVFTCERNTLDAKGRTQFAFAVAEASAGLAALKAARVLPKTRTK